MPQQALVFLFETAPLPSPPKNYTCLHVEVQVYSLIYSQTQDFKAQASFPGSWAAHAQEPGNEATTASDHQSSKTLALQ